MTKIDIFSGFLGAGKTTLIKKLIDDGYQGEKVVLIENEFGEISVDGGFLKDSGVEITEMSSGCICCSLVGDFRTSLHQVIDDFHPDRILIEPSGVGKLSDVITAVRSVAEKDVVLNGFTTVVDAGKAKMYMKNFGEFFNNQIENASCIILSRTDKVSDEKLDTALALIKEKNPEATIITTPWDQLSGRTILEAISRETTLKQTLAGMLSDAEEEEVCPVCGHHHDHDHEHHHDHDHECEHEHEHHHHDHDHECEHEHEHHHHEHDHECEHEHEHYHDLDHECEHDHEHHHDHDHGESCSCGCGHDHDHHHHHHGHDADEVFVSWGEETFHKYSEEDINSMLSALEDTDRFGMVLRSKGYVAAADGGDWIYFDYTPGEINVRRGSADVTGRICVIGSRIRENELKELFRLG